MKTKVLITLFGSLVILVVVAVGLVAAKPDNPGQGKKPDKQKPVHATDVELVKKITIRGRPPWAGGGKPKKEGAATGVLGEEVTGSKYAVVVGISDYPGEENDLNYSDDDALEMSVVLTDVYEFTKVTLLADEDATRQAILDAIDDIPTDADEIVFFFSGHGASGIADDGDKERLDEAIVAHNGEDLVPIWDGELQGAFSEFTTSRIVFIFDTCLAGGMERDLAEPGRVIAMATSERGYAYESDAWHNGEFSYYFVDLGTLQGKANVHDYDGDTILEVPEQVTVEEAFDYAKTNCQYDKPTIGDEFEDDLLP
jgi:hypothetical protein